MLSTTLLTLFAALPFLCVQVQAGNSTTSAPSALPTSLSNLPPCVLNCTTQAATQTGCSSISDLACVCTNTNFQDKSAVCLQAQCTASDRAAANKLYISLCASANSTTTASGSSTGRAASSSSVAATASASSSASAGTAAYGLSTGLGTGYIIGFVAVLAGIITEILF